MRILIDGHMIGTHEGGNERYTKNIFTHLQNLNKNIYIELYKSSTFQNNWFRLFLGIPTEVKRNKYDLVHSNYNPPFIKNAKFVVTLHDLSFKRYESLYNFRERFMFKYLLPYSLLRADAIIVPSEFTKNEAEHFFPQYKKKLFITYEAADDIFKHTSYKLSQKNLKEKFNIKRPFLLTINSKNPKKNIQRVIDAFFLLRNPNIDLVIIGGNANITTKNLTPHIHILDFISDPDLNDFYNSCEIFIYFSLYEGFGLPILEAINCHRLVIASDIEVHREITQNRITYADPKRAEDLVKKILLILNNENLKKKLIKQTLPLISKYSWNKTALETYNVYKKILSK